MKYQRIAAALLQLALITTATAQQPAPENIDQKLSVAEEREARALGEDFIARFEASADIASLLPMFTSDFRKRLRYVGDDLAYPIATIDTAVIKLASDEDLLGCYSQSVNFSYLVARHYAAALWLRKQAGRDDSDQQDHLTFADIVPVEVVKLLQSDPAIREGFLRYEQSSRKNDPNESLSLEAPPDGSTQNESLSDSATPSSQNSEPHDAEGEDHAIKTVAALSNYIRTLEQANSLLRKSAKSLVTLGALTKAFRDQEYEGEPAAEEEDLLNPRAFVLGSEWLNYPAGERLICVDALLFHMDLVRVHGRLQVAALYVTSGCSR